MKNAPTIVSTIFISTVIAPVSAKTIDNWYVGSLYTEQKISLSPVSRDFNTAGIIVGYQYNNYMAVETRFSKGTSGNTFNVSLGGFPAESFDTDINYQTSLLIKVSYPLTDRFGIYATSGYSKTKIDQNGTFDSGDILTDVNTAKHSYTESGLIYGLGFDYKVSNSVRFFIDYNILSEFNPNPAISADWKSINIGFNYAF